MIKEKTMNLKIRNNGNVPVLSLLQLAAMTAILVTGIMAGISYAAQQQKMFGSADEAIKAVVAATRDNNDDELLAIFGPDAEDIIKSGDAVMDKHRREKFLKAYDKRHSLVAEGGGRVLVLGENDWPYPIPVVNKGNAWFFDTAKGREEILDRRIGKDELSAIQVCLGIAGAQRKYAETDHSGNGAGEYAQKFISDAGQKNGLYWKIKEGEKLSPLGPAVAKAQEEGYERKQPGEKPSPFHGYLYRMLKAQGKNAQGGARDYVMNGRMTGGFAAVAYPVEYGNSGVMTFIVSRDGTVYQKDLGKDTGSIARAMKDFDPDKSWKKLKTRLNKS
jgi:hypothetical protein